MVICKTLEENVFILRDQESRETKTALDRETLQLQWRSWDRAEGEYYRTEQD